MSRLQQSSVNMIASLAGYVVPMCVNLVSTPLLLKGLGAAAFGLQSLVAVIIGYFTLMDMGLSWPIIKYLAEDHAKDDIASENRILSTTLQLYGVIGVLGMIIIFLMADWLAQSVFKVPAELIPQAIMVFRLAGIGFLASVGTSWGQALAMGLQRFEISYSVSAVSNVVGVGTGLGVVYAGYGVVGYVLARVVVTFLSGPLYWVLTRQFLPTFRVRWGVDRKTLSRISGYVGYGAINRVISSIVSRLDQMLIGIWFGVAAAGVYSVPFLVVNALGSMIGYMLGFIFPLASELQSLGQMEQFKDIFMRASQFIAALAGLIFIPLFLMGDILLKLWVPTIADQAMCVLQLLAVSGYINTLAAGLSNSVMIGLGKMQQFTIYTSVRALVVAVGCIILIRPFGIEGAGWALLFACSVDVVYFVIFLRRYIQISPYLLLRKAYLKPMLLGVAFAILTFFCRSFATSWISLTAVGIGLLVVYVTVGLIIGVFDESVKRMIMIFYNLIKDRLTTNYNE